MVVRLVDFKNDKWKMIEEETIWGKAIPQDTSKGIIDQFATMKFGQPSLLKLDDAEYLAAHWCVEDCQHIIKSHRLKVEL